MAAIDDLYIRILADGSQLESGLNHAQGKIDGFSSGINKLGGQLKEAFSIIAIEEFIRSAVNAAEASDRAMAKVAQAIKTTNGAAGLSLAELKVAADEFKNSTLFDDDQVLNDVSAQLLTFSNLAGDNFKRAQVAALDFATVLGDGEGLKGISIQLGKALNDPVKGLTALQRSGVSFSETQKELIKGFAETNQIAKAQEVILGEIERQYGGQATAAMEASNGVKMLGKSFEDLMKSIGGAINHSSGFKSELHELASEMDAWSDDRVSVWNAMLVTMMGDGDKFMEAQRVWEKELQDTDLWDKNNFGNQGESTAPVAKPVKSAKDTTYSDLTDKLKEYQTALQLSTTATRDAINRQIETQKGLIKAWEDSGKAVENYKGTLKGMGLEIAALEEQKSTTTDPAVIAQLNELIEKKKEEKNVLDHTTRAWLDYGNSVNETVNGRVVPSVSKMTSTWQQMSVAVPAAFEHIHDATDKLFADMTAKMKAVNTTISEAIKSAIANVASRLGVLIGDLINGSTGAGDAIMGSLGKIIGQVGQMAISIGVAMLTIQLTLANPLNPALPLTLIGLGIAAVALGQVFSNASKSIASGGSASGSYSSGGSGNTYDTRTVQPSAPQTVALTLQGRDLVAAIAINKLYYNRQG